MGGVHSHHGHAHQHGADARSLGIAAALTGAFMLAEVAGGLVSGSLALLSDAGHMLTDFGALALAWYGMRLARRPADEARSYGYGRFTVLVAFGNGLALFAIAGWICVEAVFRLLEPAPVLGGLMLVVAVAGLVVNVVAFWVLHRMASGSLNVRAAALHVMGDLLGSVAAIVAAGVIMTTGWYPADPILSVVVALLILRSAWKIVGESAHILLEGTPRGLDPAEVADDLVAQVPGLEGVYHFHAWSISEDRVMATLHARIAAAEDVETVVAAIKRRLSERYDIGHATVEPEQTGIAGPDPQHHAEAS